MFGEVEYQRRVYQTVRDDGSVAYVYLLDKELEIPGVGKMSWNMAHQLVNGITDMSYRDCAGHISENRDGLIPWTERGLDVPEGHEGLAYRGMGTMENHIWSVIARRMKHNHASWSIKGGDNLAKILARKACGRLGEVADRLGTGRFGRAVTEGI